MGIDAELNKLIMKRVFQCVQTGRRISTCTGFCKQLDLPRVPNSKVESIPHEAQHLMSMLVLATLGSHQVNQPESRQMRKVDNTKAPVVTDGFVGVCCKSMMRLCEAIKLSMLQPAKQADNQARDTRFDGKVESDYEKFPRHTYECTKLSQPGWKPSMDSMWQWIRICMKQKWTHPRESKIICMEPLDIRKGARLASLITYAGAVTR